MSLPFDATLKDLAQLSPKGILAAFHVDTSLPVSLLNVDLSTVTTSTDIVFGIGEPPQSIVHMDFQSSGSAKKHADILVYNALLYRQYSVPVHSMVILLRPHAEHRNLHGLVTYSTQPERGKMDFSYEVIRLWNRSAEELPVGALPLAVLGRLPSGVELEVGLAAIIKQLIDRLENDAAPEQTRRLLTAAFVLSRLRLPKDTALQLFQRVRTMRDSTTYLAILDEGAIALAKKLIVRMGRKKLGTPDEGVTASLSAMDDLDRLERIADRLLEAENWQDLLSTP